jgi:hypothetical protein
MLLCLWKEASLGSAAAYSFRASKKSLRMMKKSITSRVEVLRE